jgi:hypothetical protein
MTSLIAGPAAAIDNYKSEGSKAINVPLPRHR